MMVTDQAAATMLAFPYTVDDLEDDKVESQTLSRTARLQVGKAYG